MNLEQFRAKVFGVRQSKYGNTQTVVDGHRFDSKLEGLRYLYWINLWRAGAIELLLRQVPFDLPGNIIYRLDFMVIGHPKPGEGRWILYEDCKGHMTRVSENKIKQVEDIYKIKVDLIGKGGKPWQAKVKAKNTKTKTRARRKSTRLEQFPRRGPEPDPFGLWDTLGVTCTIAVCWFIAWAMILGIRDEIRLLVRFLKWML